jgi:hypothetical protein
LSLLATATCGLLNPVSVTIALDTAVLLMKLWVQTESNRVMRSALLMETSIAMVRVVRDCMLVSAWMEMVGSLSPGEGPYVSFSSTTSMMKSFLQCSQWPGVKSSSHLKHLPSL